MQLLLLLWLLCLPWCWWYRLRSLLQETARSVQLLLLPVELLLLAQQ